MRTPKRCVAKDGAVTWKVRYRLDGHETSETFDEDEERRALRFAQLLDVLDPHAALKQIYGETYDGDAFTLDEIAERFFDWKQDKVRSDRTIADYRRDYRNWIKPALGSRPAVAVDEEAVQTWVDTMATGRDWMTGEGTDPGPFGRKLAPKSVADRHALLHQIYGWASAPSRGMLNHNPCVGTQMPPRVKTPPKGLRPAEWQALHAALRRLDPDAADLAEFLISTGWRISEAIALTAYAVEDYGDDQPIYISMEQVVRRNAAGQHVIVQDGKSDAAERRIKLDLQASAMMRRRLATVTDDGLVFTNARGHQWHYSNFLNRAWNPAVKVAKLSRKPTPHWLRHTHVAWLVMAGGVSLAEIQRRVGHDQIDTTIGVYGRMIDDVTAEALSRFAAFRDQKLVAAPSKKQLS